MAVYKNSTKSRGYVTQTRGELNPFTVENFRAKKRAGLKAKVRCMFKEKGKKKKKMKDKI